MNQQPTLNTQSQYDQWFSEDKAAIAESIIDNTNALLRISNLDGNSKYVNQAWINFTGSVFTNEHTLTDNIHPDCIESYLVAWKQALSENSEFSATYLLLHRSGEYKWVSEFTKPIFHSDGSVTGYLSTAVDIHAQKEKEVFYSEKLIPVLKAAFHNLSGNIGVLSGASNLLQLMEKKEDRDNTLEMIKRNVRQMQSTMTELLDRIAAKSP